MGKNTGKAGGMGGQLMTIQEQAITCYWYVNCDGSPVIVRASAIGFLSVPLIEGAGKTAVYTSTGLALYCKLSIEELTELLDWEVVSGPN